MQHVMRAEQGRWLVALLLTLAWVLGPNPNPTSAAGARSRPPGAVNGDRGSKIRASAPAGQPQYATQMYFAEGYTGQGPLVNFTEKLSILNTNPLTATGEIEYFLANTSITATNPITVPIMVPAHAQLIEDVGRDVGSNQMVSTLVEADQTLSATRTISRTTVAGAALGASISEAEDGLAQFWYFSEGYTGASFQEYLALFNPGNSPATITIEAVGVAGAQVLAPLSASVAAHGRATVNIRAAVPGRSLGLSVQSDQPIAAERVLYWGAGSGSGKFGASVNAGIRGPAAQWTFPYVSTAGADQAYLSFINPTTVAAHVQLSAYGAAALPPLPSAVIVAPGIRTTVTLPISVGSMAVVASSDVPVIAEEGQYFGGSPNVGTHMGSVLAGVPQPAIQWSFPGVGGSRFTTQTWYVLNRSSGTADLTATVYPAQAGVPIVLHFHAPPGVLTVLSTDSARLPHAGTAVFWGSTAPVVIARVFHGASASVGAVVAGVSQS
ncbi:MAG TPA: DUF5719 family protein [Chloroflexota bacterium]|nr:DUF5719 family protein [Chloroflexota bacterium]